MSDLRRFWAELLVRAKLDPGDAVGLYSRVLRGTKWREKISPDAVFNDWQRFFKNHGTSHEISVCLQIPYGDRKCDFCNCPVKSRIDTSAQVAGYLADIKREADYFSPLLGRRTLRTFSVRGLPSLYSDDQLADCLDHASSLFNSDGSKLRFIEFEPNGTTPKKLSVARSHGFNLVSFRIQPLGSSCRSQESLAQSVGWARDAGFDLINIDLVLGLTQGAESQLLENLGPIAELRPNAISMHRLTFADLYSKKVEMKRDLNEKRYRETFVREEEEKRILNSLGRMGYQGLPWIPLHRRWIVHLKGTADAAIGALQEMVPFEGSEISYMGLGQFSRSVIGNNAYERYLSRPFSVSQPLYRAITVDVLERMMHYIVSSLETYSRIDFRQFKACFGEDFRETFEDELRALEKLGKISADDEHLYFLPERPKDRTFYQLFFLTRRMPKISRELVTA